MKRFLCILTALLFLAGTASAYDSHLHAEGVFSGQLEGRTVTADLFEKDSFTTVVSSLLPNTVIELENAGGEGTLLNDLQGLFAMRPEDVSAALEKAESMLFAWTGTQKNETAAGAYAGELFDRAATVSSCRFSLSEFAEYLRGNLAAARGTDRDGMNAFLNRLLYDTAGRWIVHDNGTDPEILFSSYDEGSWYTILVTVDGAVIMTLSADRTAGDGRRLLVSYKENGLYCFRDTEFRMEGKQISVSSAVRTGKEPSFRKAAEQAPLCTESFTLAGDTATSCTFECVFSSDTLVNPMIMIGKITSPEAGKAGIDADVFIRGHEADTLSVTVNTDSAFSGGEFSGYQVIKTDREKENAGIRLTAVSGLTLLAAEILPTLPGEYQKMIVKFFLK